MAHGVRIVHGAVAAMIGVEGAAPVRRIALTNEKVTTF
jgi:hypothetical protein